MHSNMSIEENNTVALNSLHELTRNELIRMQNLAIRLSRQGFLHMRITQPEDWFWGGEGTTDTEGLGVFSVQEVIQFEYGRDYAGD